MRPGRRPRTRARLCAECGQRPAKYRVRAGRVQAADDGHTLCFQCFRAEQNRARAKRQGDR